MYSCVTQPLRPVLIMVLFISLLSCSGGGSGSGGETTPSTSVATPAATVVSGTVIAPNGQIALFKERGLDDLFLSEAYAAVTGLASVIDGTPVELGRIGLTSPFTFSVIASTVTSGGRFSFNFTNLGLTPAVDLVIRVKNGATEMHAFVTGTTVNVSPMTEVAFLRSLQQLGNAPLTQFTAQELADIAGSITVLANLQNLALTAQNMSQALTTISGAVQDSPSITNFVAAASLPGQTTQGLGDLGNFYPLGQGNRWDYQGTISRNGGASVVFKNTASVNGTKVINGVPTLVHLESNPDNDGSPNEDYIVKDERGIAVHGNTNADDSITPLIVPLQAIHFPLYPGATFTSVDRKRVPTGRDLDGDGINDVVDVLSEYSIPALEALTVAAGTFNNTLRIEKKEVGVFYSSAFGVTATIISNETTWVAPGIGPVKRTETSKSEGFAQDVIESVTEELTGSIVDGLGQGGIAATRILNLATNDLVYDKVSKRIYASVPGNPGIIQPIDPETLGLDTPISVGSNPNILALSDDGQYLYVGLDGEAAVQRIHIPSRMAGPKFPLSTDEFIPGCGPLTAEDIAVVPGSPLSIAVSRYQFGCISHRGLSILDNGVPRPLITTSADRNSQIEFGASPSVLYGYNNHDSGHEMRTNSITPQGITVLNITRNVFNSNEIRYGAGRIFEQFGRVYDPTSRTVVGSLSPFGSIVGVIPDPASGKVFSVGVPQNGNVLIQANDLNTLQVLGSSRAEGISFVSAAPGISLVRWGSNGLVFRSFPDKVVVVRSSLVQ